MPLLQASNMFKISRRTLARHRDQKVRNPGHTSLGNYKMALDVETENQLHGHIKYMEKCLYGLTTTDLRKLAFEYAVISKLNHPFNTEKKMAGKDWLRGYLTRYPDLSIRTPQATSIQRAVGFKRPKVDQFYATYKNLLDTHTLSPSRIYNMDETGITEVHKPGKVIASKGARQVGKITSAERESTVTLVCAMSAVGTYLPPMYIFYRKRMVEVLMNGAPPQSVGYVSDSGWTDSELFVKWLEHFVAITNASTNAQHAIIMDGHQSHKTLAAVNFARRHGIHLLTLPSHSTHKMQPLDRTFFKALKSAYNAEADSWMVSNHGRRITHYDIAGISGKAFLRTATPDKAIKGFECCGLWPFDANIFTENDFAPAYLTEEPAPADAADDTNVADPSASTSTTTAAHPAPSTPVVHPSSIAAHPTPSMPVAGPSASTSTTTAAHPAPSTPVVHPSATAAHPAPSTPVAGPSASTPITTAAHPAPSTLVAGPSANMSATTAALPSSASVCNKSATIRQLIERISPKPKATCSRQRKRKVESAAVITSSPYKKLLQEKEQKKKSSQKKTSGKGKGKAKGKGKGKGKRKAPAHDDSSEDEEWPCLICGEPFVNSKSREMWIQCLQYKNWTHSDCTDESVYFVCPNCESDLEE